MQEENIIIKLWKIVYPVLIYYVISMLIGLLFGIIYMIYYFGTGMSSGTAGSTESTALLVDALNNVVNKYTMELTGAAQIVTIPIVGLLYRSDRKRFLLTNPKKNPVNMYLILGVLAIASSIGFNNMISISNLIQLFPGYNDTAEILYGSNIMITAVVTIVLAPIVEEFIFRGLVYGRLARYWNKNLAMLLSALFFGIYHGNVVQGVYAFLLGLILAYLYEKFETIKAPILAHAVANLISVVLTKTTFFNPLFENNVLFICTTVVTVGIVFLILYYFEKLDSTPSKEQY